MDSNESIAPVAGGDQQAIQPMNNAWVPGMFFNLKSISLSLFSPFSPSPTTLLSWVLLMMMMMMMANAVNYSLLPGHACIAGTLW
jgi:hypothetical protein